MLLENRALHPRELHRIFWKLQPGSWRELEAAGELLQKQMMTHPVLNRNSFSQHKNPLK